MKNARKSLAVVVFALSVFVPFWAGAQQQLPSVVLSLGPNSEPAAPDRMAVAPSRNRIYVSVRYNSNYSTVVVINGSTDTVVATIPIGYETGGIIYDPNNDRVYVATIFGGIHVIHPDTNTVESVISSVPESTYLAINTVTNRIYASQWRFQRIEVIDGETNQNIAHIDLDPDTPNPGPLAVNPNTNKIYMSKASGTSFPLTIIDGATNSVISRNFGADFRELVIDLNHDRLYAGDDNTATYSVMDLSNDQLLATDLPLAPTNNPNSNNEFVHGIAYNSATNRIHFSKSVSATLDSVNPSDYSLLSNLQLTGAENLFGMVVNPNTNKIYIAQRNTGGASTTPGRIHIVSDCGASCSNNGSHCLALPSGLVGWWRAEGNGDDLQNGKNGTLLNGATFAAGKVGQAFRFDGFNDYVSAPFTQTGPFTVDLWVKANTLSQMVNTSILSTGFPNHFDPYFQIEFDGSGNYEWTVGNLVLTIGPIATQFQHIAVTYDGAAVKTYLNGQLTNTMAYGMALSFEVLKFGINRNESNPFNGLVDEVDVFNRALSAQEVAAIYNAADAGKCDANTDSDHDGAPDAADNCPGAANADQADTDADGIGSVCDNCSNIANPFQADANDNGIGDACEPGLPPCGLVGWWRAEDNADDSQNGKNGTLLNGTAFVPGKVGQAFSLDGIDDYVLAPFTQTGHFSVDLWVQANEPLQPVNTSVLSTGFPGHYDPYFQIEFDGFGNYEWTVGNLVLPIGAITTQFQHLAVTYDGAVVNVYLNGVLTNSMVYGSSLSFEVLKMGINRDQNRPFNGLIDEVGVYSRALSAAEVATIYNESGAVKCETEIDTDPIAVDDAYITNEDTALNIDAQNGLLTNDAYSGTGPITANQISGPQHGTLMFLSDGSFVYTSELNFSGSDSFTYTAQDGTLESNPATVTINVVAVNDEPAAVEDEASTLEDSPVSISVLSNDTDPDGDSLTISFVTQSANGLVTNNANGIVTYLPNANFNGIDIFEYTMTDSNGGTDTGTVIVNVAAINDAPLAKAGVDQTAACSNPSGTPVPLNASESSDLDGDTLSYTWTGPFGTVAGTNPTVTLPIGNSLITLTATDGALTATDTISVLVTVQVTGFLQPLEPLIPAGSSVPIPDNAFKQGNTLPLKLQIACGGLNLTDQNVSAPHINLLVRSGSALQLDTIDLNSGLSNDNGLYFRFANGVWIYNLSTKTLIGGTYTITIGMSDTTTYSSSFVLR